MGGSGALCCWPHSDTSSGRYSRKSTIDNESAGRLCSLESRGAHTSAASLQLPTTSGLQTKQPLCAHRSHEEIRRRSVERHGDRHGERHGDRHGERLEVGERYSSAPSVIEEVVRRRAWDRSGELHIPLHSDAELDASLHSAVHRDSDRDSDDDDSYDAPLARAESLSIEDRGADERSCKKHHTNIKSSKKESHDDDVKDVDVTELGFYIGEQVRRDDTLVELSAKADSLSTLVPDARTCRLKDEKQSLNESIKSMERSLEQSEYRAAEDRLDALDRSGATHSLDHNAEIPRLPYTPSVEAVEYGSCVSPAGGAGWGAAGCRGGRHASDTDVIARAARPRSAPFSESELELDLSCDEAPPPYEALPVAPPRRETAV